MLPVSPAIDDRVDYSAGTSFEHVLQRGLRHLEGAGQVDCDDLAPVLSGHDKRQLVDGDSGVVDQDVQPAVLGDHL